MAALKSIQKVKEKFEVLWEPCETLSNALHCERKSIILSSKRYNPDLSALLPNVWWLLICKPMVKTTRHILGGCPAILKVILKSWSKIRAAWLWIPEKNDKREIFGGFGIKRIKWFVLFLRRGAQGAHSFNSKRWEHRHKILQISLLISQKKKKSEAEGGC